MGRSVSLGNTPRVIIGSRSPRNPISTGGPGFMQLSIEFDRVVRPAYDQPRSLSFFFTSRPQKREEALGMRLAMISESLIVAPGKQLTLLMSTLCP